MKNRRIFESIFMLLIFLAPYSEAPRAGLDLEEVQVFAVMPETPPAGSYFIQSYYTTILLPQNGLNFGDSMTSPDTALREQQCEQEADDAAQNCRDTYAMSGSGICIFSGIVSGNIAGNALARLGMRAYVRFAQTSNVANEVTRWALEDVDGACLVPGVNTLNNTAYQFCDTTVRSNIMTRCMADST